MPSHPRHDELTAKAKAGTLTPTERAELKKFTRAAAQARIDAERAGQPSISQQRTARKRREGQQPAVAEIDLASIPKKRKLPTKSAQSLREVIRRRNRRIAEAG